MNDKRGTKREGSIETGRTRKKPLCRKGKQNQQMKKERSAVNEGAVMGEVMAATHRA